MSEVIKEYANIVLQAVGQHMYGMDDVIRLALVALYAEGHVLLEGNPGLGKTDLVKTLGKTLQLEFGRIQFTPDLMPADITGTLMPDPQNVNSLRFQKGPIFTELLLADEINRATPKTQSAMLEAMAERQVTVLGERHPLPTPFIVLATQNPIDHEGTYDLPAAQADRFMFKIIMPNPDADTLRLILHKTAGKTARDVPSRPSIGTKGLPRSEEDALRIHADIKQAIEDALPLTSVETHIVNMILASHQQFAALEGLERSQHPHLERLVKDNMTYGLGPRTSTALMRGAKAWALLFRPHENNATGPALARVALPVLRHRVKLDFDWERRYREFLKDRKAKLSPSTHGQAPALLEHFLADFILATAPTLRSVSGYREEVLQELIDMGVQPLL